MEISKESSEVLNGILKNSDGLQRIGHSVALEEPIGGILNLFDMMNYHKIGNKFIDTICSKNVQRELGNFFQKELENLK